MSNPAEFLRSVVSLVAERGQTHGDWRENMESTAAMWSLFLQHPITSEQVCIMMALNKASRMACGGQKDDHFRDFTGYGALGGACALAKEKEKSGST